jgi:hypothetical protein
MISSFDEILSLFSLLLSWFRFDYFVFLRDDLVEDFHAEVFEVFGHKRNI